MATIITGAAAVARTPVAASKGTSTVSKGGGYVFYSDNPEAVDAGDLADAGKWLNRDTVTGAGLVYLWHHNVSGASLQHTLTIYNPNSFAIRVSTNNYGLTNHASNSDVAAWQEYFTWKPTLSIVINPLSYGQLFPARTIAAGNNFGILGQINITNNATSAAASAVLFDLAWVSNSSGATAFANIKSPTMRRGKAPTYYNTINFAPLSPTDTNGVYYSIAGSTSYPGIFGTDDIPYVTDPSGAVSGLLYGGYGQQYYINMTIRNTTGTARKFRVFLGRTTGFYIFPIVNMGGSTVRASGWTSGGTYVDMIETNTIPHNGTETFSFYTVIPAISTTPLRIGARTI